MTSSWVLSIPRAATPTGGAATREKRISSWRQWLYEEYRNRSAPHLFWISRRVSPPSSDSHHTGPWLARSSRSRWKRWPERLCPGTERMMREMRRCRPTTAHYWMSCSSSSSYLGQLLELGHPCLHAGQIPLTRSQLGAHLQYN